MKASLVFVMIGLFAVAALGQPADGETIYMVVEVPTAGSA